MTTRRTRKDKGTVRELTQLANQALRYRDKYEEGTTEYERFDAVAVSIQAFDQRDRLGVDSGVKG